MKIAFFLSLFFTFTAFAEEGILYVQAVKTPLREAPAVSAKTLTELKRGTELKVVETKDLWVKVNTLGKTGWVAKLSTNTYKPIGQAKLQQELQGSPEKSSRKRSSSYAVSASTRGLSESSRVRTGREAYKADADALTKMEANTPTDAEVDNFAGSVTPKK